MFSFCRDEAPLFSRAHKKSKRGCITCKLRKVKVSGLRVYYCRDLVTYGIQCDETRPACKNCSRRCPDLVACDYPPAAANARRLDSGPLVPLAIKKQPSVEAVRVAANSPLPINGIDLHPAGITDTKYRRLEMRLLHHYTTITSLELPYLDHKEPQQGLWKNVAPQLGFMSDLVLESLMAFSALHLRTLCPEDINLQAAELRYHSNAINRQRTAVSAISKSDPREVFTTATLIFHHTWLTENLAAVSAEEYYLPTKIYHLAHATKKLFFSLPEMQLGYLELYCPPIHLVKAIRPHPSNYIETGLAATASMFPLLEIWPTAQQEDREVLRAGLQAVDDLINTFTGPNAFPMGQNILALLPLRTSHRYVELLDEHDPLAMAILALNYALQHAMDRVWWMHGIKGMELASGNIKGIMGLIPAQYEWMVRWPLDVAEGRIDFDLFTCSNENDT